jgi:hypothetical protein
MSSSRKPTLRIDWCSYEAAKYAVMHWHYSRSLPCSKTARLGVWEDGRFIGAVVFAWGANRYLAGEYKLKMTECAELCRIALAKHSTPVSRILSIVVKMLKREMPGIRLIVSYADLNHGHFGCSHPDFLALQGKLPRHLKDPAGFLYYSGWRVREMRKIQWKHLDPSGKSLRLPPELSKNKKGRLLPLTGELAAIIKRAKARRRLDCSSIFHHNVKPIGSFRKAWKTACVAAGLGRFIEDEKGKKKYEGLIVHDLRRSCVRHLIQAGVGEKLAMQLTGHKTRSVFDRYNIVSDADLQEASERQQAYLAKQKQEPTTVTPMNAGS